MEGTHTAALDHFRPRAASLRTAAATGSGGFDVEGVVGNANLLNSASRSSGRTLRVRSRSAVTCLIFLPCGSLRLGHVGGKLFPQFVIHPANTGQGLITLVALRRPLAEIPGFAEKVLGCLT